jgi:hypothetical protein
MAAASAAARSLSAAGEVNEPGAIAAAFLGKGLAADIMP